MKFRLPDPQIPDEQVQRNFEALLAAANVFGSLLDVGTGVPSHSPEGRRIYVDRAGSAGSILYVWDGATWTAFA